MRWKPNIQDLFDGKAPWFWQYIFNQGVHLSQWASVRLGGDPDDTISARTERAKRTGHPFFTKFFAPLVEWIFNDPDHGDRALADDEELLKQLWEWGSPGRDRPRDYFFLIVFFVDVSFTWFCYYLFYCWIVG